MTCLIVPLMVQYGMILQLWTAPNSGVTLYASEVQAAIGYSVPRWFDRCVERVGGAGTLREDGILEFPVASIPTSGTDPVFGSAHVVGDFARLRAPTFGTTEGGVAYTLTGWRYDGSVWQPQYTLGTMAASGSHIVDALIDGATSADVTLSTDAATTVASQLFSGWGSSKHFNVTLGFRATVWQSGDVTVSGSIDETVDCHVATDGSGVATVTIQGTQYPDATRLPGGLSGATAALATTTGGVTVQVTRPAGVACKSRARVFVARREEIS
jgi:hypothetical protein